MATNYPDSVKGIHYRLRDNGSSSRWGSDIRYITVSFVLERNLRHPELGFNFAETLGQGVVYSSQLCFLTEKDAENFAKKYGLEKDYSPYISNLSDYTLIRINAGGDIPCYTSIYCCEHYGNRISADVKARMKLTPVLSSFANEDPKLQARAAKIAKREAKKEVQRQIIAQALQGFEGVQQLRSDIYGIPLNLDSKVWVTSRYGNPWVDKPLVVFRQFERAGEVRFSINSAVELVCTPLADFSERAYKIFQEVIERALKTNLVILSEYHPRLEVNWEHDDPEISPGRTWDAERIRSYIQEYVNALQDAANTVEAALAKGFKKHSIDLD